jgi:DNA modification methylase
MPLRPAKLQLINGNCLKVLPTLGQFDCVFVDPPDNIGVSYNSYKDKVQLHEYYSWIARLVDACVHRTKILWISFNSAHTIQVAKIISTLIDWDPKWVLKPCVQTFTFGQHNHHWLGNNHRPLWCLYHTDATFYPESIRVASWRQLNGDKRADPRGRVPGDVFDFPRVTGNSHQRRPWHPTQLHEGLVERVIQFSTPVGGTVLDPCVGSGTTLRVAKRLHRNATGIELDSDYCSYISEELDIPTMQLVGDALLPLKDTTVSLRESLV